MVIAIDILSGSMKSIVVKLRTIWFAAMISVVNMMPMRSVISEKMLVSTNRSTPIGMPIFRWWIITSGDGTAILLNSLNAASISTLKVMNTAMKKMSQYVMAVAYPAPIPPSSGNPKFPKINE